MTSRRNATQPRRNLAARGVPNGRDAVDVVASRDWRSIRSILQHEARSEAFLRECEGLMQPTVVPKAQRLQVNGRDARLLRAAALSTQLIEDLEAGESDAETVVCAIAQTLGILTARADAGAVAADSVNQLVSARAVLRVFCRHVLSTNAHLLKLTKQVGRKEN